MKSAVIITTRNRPELFRRAAQSVFDTSQATAYCVIDHNEERTAEYVQIIEEFRTKKLPIVLLSHPDSGSSPKGIDWAWRQIEFDIVMTMGDDSVIRTQLWDVIAWNMLEKDPYMMISSNDGRGRLKLENIICTRHWPDAVGFLINPVFEHFCADEWVERIATAAGKITYAMNIIVEHMHPKFGKGVWDAVYLSKRKGGGNDRDRARLAAMDDEILKAASRILIAEKSHAVAQPG